MYLNFRVAGEMQLQRKFLGIADKIKDFREAFARIASDFYDGQKATFEAEGAFDGKKKWKKLNKDYKRWKESKGFDSNILVLEGTLKRAATEPNEKGSVFNIQKTKLEFGVNLPVNGWNLAMLHQTGTLNQTGTTKMPARKVIELSQKQKLRWVRIFRDWVQEITKARG